MGSPVVDAPLQAAIKLPRDRFLEIRGDSPEIVKDGMDGMLSVELICVSGWHPPESSGVRAAKPEAMVRFRADAPVGTRINLVLRLAACGRDFRIRIRPGSGTEIEALVAKGSDKLAYLVSEVEPGNLVTARLMLDGDELSDVCFWMLKGILYFDPQRVANQSSQVTPPLAVQESVRLENVSRGDRILVRPAGMDESRRAASFGAPPIPVFDIKRYLEINDRSEDPFIFTLTNRGFFSEVNNLLNAIAFGLITKRRLSVVQQRPRGINWSDFFDADLPLQKRRGDVPVDPEWVITGVSSRHFHTIRGEICELWDRRNRLDIPSLGLRDMDIFQLLRILADSFCGRRQHRIFGGPVRPARTFAGAIAEQLGALGLQAKEFAAIHVRRGDKIEGEQYIGASGKEVHRNPEGEMTPLSTYIDLMGQHAKEVRTIFVISDDYSAVEELRDLVPAQQVRTLCPKNAAGYYNDRFYRMSRTKRIQSHEGLLAGVRIASQSALFLGPYKSNLSRFVANIHWDPTRCVSVDAQREWTPL